MIRSINYKYLISKVLRQSLIQQINDPMILLTFLLEVGEPKI